jgi:molybdopterin biosynthesis enzyme
MSAENNRETVRVEDAVGRALLHDITRIIPGREKGPAFRKGHIISEEDVELLKDLGRDRIYVFRIPEDEYHEDDAAVLFKSFAGRNVTASNPSEGKIVFRSAADGLVIIEKNRVKEINRLGSIALTTIHSHTEVRRGEPLAGARIIPLTVRKDIVDTSLGLAGGAVLEVMPFRKTGTALIVTGSEVASGRIKDGFRPVIEKKVSRYGSRVSYFRIVGDSRDQLSSAVEEAGGSGCGLIIITGGMSVDPDDISMRSCLDAGVEIVTWGAPLLPGNMFMAAYLGNIPVFGVPACALFSDITVLDIFLPYAFAGARITRDDISERGYGGYCRHCETCNFPRCGFGKC